MFLLLAQALITNCYTVDMLLLSQSFIGQPVMSLRTGGPIATITTSIINPNNLKIEGFYCQDRFKKKKQVILLAQDIRDVIARGIVVNDHESLTSPEDLVRLEDIIATRFSLTGKPVITVSKNKLGKITDYAADSATFFIQKLYVSQPVLKNITKGTLSIDRSQIVEITNRKIVVQDLAALDKIGSVVTAPAQ